MFKMKNNNSQTSRFVSVDVSLIDPNPLQPRRIFDDYELMRLAASIRQNGLLQPITVRSADNGRYYLIAGERRLRAVKSLGWGHIDAIVMKTETETAAILALVENLQRQNLGIFEEAEGILRIINTYGLTATEAAEQIGIAPSTLSNKLRLLKLSPAQRDRITAAGLTERHARALTRLEGSDREQALNKIIAEEMTVRQTDEFVDKMLTPEKDGKQPVKDYAVNDIRIVTNSIGKVVDAIKRSGFKARALKSETGTKIEYRIIIDKPNSTGTAPFQMKMPDLI